MKKISLISLAATAVFTSSARDRHEIDRPLTFIENKGQINTGGKADLRYYLQHGNAVHYFCADGVISDIKQYTSDPFAWPDGGNPANLQSVLNNGKRVSSLAGHVLQMKFVGSAKPSAIEGRNKQEFRASYFLGNKPEKWIISAASYGKIVYRDVWTGIDVSYYGKDDLLKYDVTVAPGASPSQILFSYAGAEGMYINRSGELVLKTSLGEVIEQKPYTYQLINGVKKEVKAEFLMLAPYVFGFKVGSYDPGKPLVIDPGIITNHPHIGYSTYLGGSDFDQPWAIKVDQHGNTYIVGETVSLNFPKTPGAYKEEKTGSNNSDPLHTHGTSGTADNGMDVFVSKVKPDGSGLVWGSYLGGQALNPVQELNSITQFNEPDFGRGIAFDAAGNVYVTGWTHSTDFPTTTNAYQRIHRGGTLAGSTGHDFYDVFISKFSPDGDSLLYSTYLGGNADDFGIDIVLDGNENVCVTGVTGQRNDGTNTFPTKNAFQPQFGGGTFDDGKGYDAFVSKLNINDPIPDNQLIWSTFLGGANADAATCIAIDANDNLFVGGSSYSSNFPHTAGTVNPYGSGSNSFITKFSSSGARMASTAISFHSTVLGIATGPDNDVYITGRSGNNDYIQIVPSDAFYKFGDQNQVLIRRYNNSLSQLLMSVVFGGNPYQFGDDIVVDDEGNAYVTGSANFGLPTTPNAVLKEPYAHAEGFLMKVNKYGKIKYSTYIGSGGFDWARGIALGTDGSIYITGNTQSNFFPVTANAYQKNNAGGPSGLSSTLRGTSTTGNEGFVMKFNAPEDSALIPDPYYYPRTITVSPQLKFNNPNQGFNRLWFEDMHSISLSPWTANSGGNYELTFPINEAAADVTGLRFLFGGNLAPSSSILNIRIFNYQTQTWNTIAGLSTITDYNRRYLDVSGTLSNYISPAGIVKVSASADMIGTVLSNFFVLFVQTASKPFPLKEHELYQFCATGVVTNGLVIAGDQSKVCDGDNQSFECQNSLGEVNATFTYGSGLSSSSVANISVTYYTRIYNPTPNGTGDIFIDSRRNVAVSAWNVQTSQWDLIRTFQQTRNYFSYFRFNIPNPEKYLAANGEVKLRLSSNTTDIMAVDYFGITVETKPEIPSSPRFANSNIAAAAGYHTTTTGEQVLTAYPNPANEILTIGFSLTEESQAEISIFNMLGEKVQTAWQGVRSKGYYEVPVDIRNLKDGLYFYQLNTSAGKVTREVLIAK